MTNTYKSPLMGIIALNGHVVLANYRDQYVLAQSLNHKSPEPFVVWDLNVDGEPYNGSYCTSLETAQMKFVERCFPWFWEDVKKDTPAPEELIDFQQEYDTHRIGYFRGWMIVQPYDENDGEIRCYLPSDEWDGHDFPDLDYIKSTYDSEWDAGCLQEAIDFINSY